MFKKFLPPFALVFTLFNVASAQAQSCPTFPERGVQIIDALYNPTLAQGTDDQRRTLTKTILEQMVFEMPADGWVWKSASATRPPSKDSLARQIGRQLCNWDWQNGDTRKRSLNAGAEGDDITGQFVIRVKGVNHLGGATPVTPTVPTPVDTTETDTLKAQVAALTSLLSQIQQTLLAHEDRLNRIVDVEPTAARLDALAAVVTNATERLATLEARPFPTGCQATVNLGFARLPANCQLK